MGWFWDTKPDPNAKDATSNLDPSLKDFLNKQTPSSNGATAEAQQRQQIASRPQPPPHTSQTTPDQLNASTSDPQLPVPSESLFPDGRYAHLWKNYASETGQKASSHSEQDKIVDVLETIKDRKAAIGRAALENCVEEQMAERDCYRNGPWKERMLMCREQNRNFARCYSMQSRFLRALGYLSSEVTSREDEEKIQMHADKLYHEMLERERVMEEARKAGEDGTTASALLQQHQQAVIPSESTTKALGEESAWARARRKAQMDGSPVHLADFPPEKQVELKRRLLKLTPAEREVELQLMAAESRAMREYTDQIDRELKEEKQRREERRGAGAESVGDTLKRWWGYGNR